MPIQLVVGLMNPGSDYEKTRHNAGCWFVKALARQLGVTLSLEKKFHGQVGRASIAGQDCRFLLPHTFMNLSGQAVQSVASFYKIPLENILVAHDELDLPAGTVRLKRDGGHGGHNGLRDIIARMGKNFLRVRIGIGHPGKGRDVVNYVLKRPTSSEQTAIDEAIYRALDVMPWALEGDEERAMKELHTEP